MSVPRLSIWRRHPRFGRILVCVGITAACVGTVALVEWLTTPGPQLRQIHIEAFRYGVSPSVIRVNRGDDLRLTFDTRDTAHSFFLQDYGIDVKITPLAQGVVEVYDPANVEAPPYTSAEVRLTAGREGLLGLLNTVSRHRCHVYCGPMHGFEQGDIIVRPNWLFATTFGIVLALPLLGWYRVRCQAIATRDQRAIEPSLRSHDSPPGQPPDAGAAGSPGRALSLRVLGAAPSDTQAGAGAVDLFARFGWLRRIILWRPLQFWATLPVLAIFLVAILAGLLGTKVGGRNLAVMVTWVAWMFVMAVVLMPLNSRIWCMICPLPVLGEYLQRGSTTEVRPRPGSPTGNRFFGLGLRWPKFLRGALLRQLMFLCFGTAAASLAGAPKWTGLMLLSLVALATVMALVWEKRAFCQYLCPVTSFLSVYSGIGRLMVRTRSAEVCRTCTGKDCYRGNANGWACPFNVYVAAQRDNAECGVCTECYKSCPHDNVTVAWRKGPSRERFKTHGQAWQAVAMLTLAMSYSLVILSPWPALRDVVNVVDKANWARFFLYVAVLWSTALLWMPAASWLLVEWGRCRAGLTMRSRDAFRRFAPAFVPLGAALWAGFFAAMMMANYRFVLMTLSDPFNWGWDLFGFAGWPWLQLWPGAVPWLQSGLAVLGLGLSLRNGYGLWLEETDHPRRALRGFVPTGGLLLALAGGMVVYFTQF